MFLPQTCSRGNLLEEEAKQGVSEASNFVFKLRSRLDEAQPILDLSNGGNFVRKRKEDNEKAGRVGKGVVAKETRAGGNF